ncbi:MAG TPA: IPT/TIG domain-containing protein [Baekduia sp.]|nr:IPT/TIG domain-containing protein [Baekduia sp.]
MMSFAIARGRVRVLGALTALIGALVLSAGAGQAHAAGATIWSHADTFTPSGLDDGLAIGVNQQSGNLLVLDGFNQAILQMDESGTPVPFTDPALAGATSVGGGSAGGLQFLNQFSELAVDNSGTSSQGNIYVLTSDVTFPGPVWHYELQGFEASGELVFDVTRPGQAQGLGVAPNGNVWVGLGTSLEELTPAGVPTSSTIDIPFDVRGYDSAAESEFDAAGNMYIMLRGNGRVVRRSFSGAFRVLASDSFGLGLDPATGNVLSSRLREGVYEIDQYGPDGELETSTGAGVIATTGRLALSRDGRMLFMLWQDSSFGVYRLSVFGPGVRRPEADAASGVGTTSATLTGVVRPGGAPTTYEFEYGLTKNLGSVAPSAPVDAGSGTGPVTATALLTGLKPQTSYYYRLKATVGGQVVFGNVRLLRTHGAAAMVGGVGDVASTSAMFSGSVDAFDLGAATFHFLVEAVGSPFSVVSAELPVAAGNGQQQVSAPVTGLRPGQKYTVRLVATAGGVTDASAPVSFQTPQLGAVAPPPEGRSTATPYGCGAPVLTAPAGQVREGAVVTLTGSDLGVGGTVVVGGARAAASGWSVSSVSFVLPEVGAGKVPVSVNCGKTSNSVELMVTAAPSNVFQLGGGTVKGSSGAVAVALPGAGTVVSTGKYLVKSTVKVKKAGRASVQLRLTAAGKRALARSRSGALKVTAQVRYTPSGGSGRTLSKSITFKRGGSR